MQHIDVSAVTPALIYHHGYTTSDLLFGLLKSSVRPVNGESLHRSYGMVCFGRLKPGFDEQEDVTDPYVSFTCATQTEIIHFLIVQGLDISNQDTWQGWLVYAGPQGMLHSSAFPSGSSPRLLSCTPQDFSREHANPNISWTLHKVSC